MIYTHFSNLLLPEGVTTERQRTKYVFKVYRGENIIKTKNAVANKANIEKDAPSSYIEINFVGLRV